MSDATALRALTARAIVCQCGRKLYEHSRRKVPNAGFDEYLCGLNESGRFESETLPSFAFDCNRGLVRAGRLGV